MKSQNVPNRIVDLVELGLIQVSGADAKKFLQGQLTCDMEAITPTRSSLGAHCNPQGRIVSLFRLFQYQSHYYLAMPRNMVPTVLTALKKYAVFYKVQLTDASNSLNNIGCYGPAIDKLLDKIISSIPHEMDEVCRPTNYLLMIKIPSDTPRYLILGHPEPMTEIFEKLAKDTLTATMNEWKCLDIQAKLPAIYPETSGKLLPHDIHLPQLNAISFNKGCYTGQEIIARMHYRGKLKNHLYRAKIKIDSPPLPGAEIYCEQENEIRVCGMVVDSCHEEYNHYQVLLVAEETNVKNNRLFLANDQGTFEIL